MRANFLHARIVLASASPQRFALLKEYGFDVEVCPANTEEKIDPKESPEQNAERLAREKASAVFAQRHNEIVLAADTIGVSPTGKILTKAQSWEEAEEMLRNRSGKSEKVITGWAIFSPNGKISGVEVSQVFYTEIDDLTREIILQSGEWRGVAGALRIEGKEMKKVIDRYEGDHSNILGLPVGKIANILRDFPLKR